MLSLSGGSRLYLTGGEGGRRLSHWEMGHKRRDSRVEEMKADERTRNTKAGGGSRACTMYKDTEGQGRRRVRKANKIMYGNAVMTASYANLKINFK